MSSSKLNVDDNLGESWVDVDTRSCTSVSSLIMQQLGAEEMKLLREAQRESNQSSARVSLAGSHRDSLRSSPKSPPNSPVQGAPLVMEWQSYYMNAEPKEDVDYLVDWSSRPDQQPPKNWGFREFPKTDLLSIRYARVGKTSVFSRKGLYALFLTNLLSLLLGTGMGLWLGKCGYFVSAVKVR